MHIADMGWNATMVDAMNAWEMIDVPVQRSATPTVALVEIIEHRIKIDELRIKLWTVLLKYYFSSEFLSP